MVGFLILIVLALYQSPFRSHIDHLRQFSLHVRQMGYWAPFVYTAIVAVLVSVGFPRLFFCTLGGMALGFWPGLLSSIIGTQLGYYAQFLFVRWGGHALATRLLAGHKGWNRIIEQEGIPAVILARQVPIPGLLINLAFGLSPLRHRDYLIGTLIGQVPEAVPFVMFGCGALAGSAAKTAGVLGAAMAGLVLVWLGFRFLMVAMNPKETENTPASPIH
jgi:uncharacterized membrane protein YdjX (TVP38/TMEM64 family)